MTKQIKISSSIFKHIAKGRNANNTFAKSLKSSLFIKTSLLTFFIFQFITSTAQIQQPQTPTFNNYKTINVNPNNEIKNYTPTTTIPKVYSKQQNKQEEQRKELDLLKQEIAKHNKIIQQPKQKIKPIDTNVYKRDLQTFENALQQLKTLAKNPNATLEDAFYITEVAFGKPYLSKQEYTNQINKSVSFIQTWMKQNNVDANDNEAKHTAIQKFMSEPLMISESVGSKEFGTTLKTKQHLPFFYDYNDYQAVQDYRNFFVTKALATGGGQCNSMPMVYLLLAEKLNAPTYLTFAPQHSFIKYQKNNGEIVNYEATSNWHINDLWYQENLFISPEAIQSGIYMDTLNKQKIIAQCILELATQYTYKMPFIIDEGEFIKKCLWEANKYYPRQNNINAYFLYSVYLKGSLQNFLFRHNITNLDQIKNNEFAYSLQKEYQQNEAYIKELGYQDMPKEMYENMLKQHEDKNQQQQKRKLNGKQKRNLFIETK
jgi:hypothetical protein